MVDSVAATLELITANGGKIVQPIGGDAPEITARFSWQRDGPVPATLMKAFVAECAVRTKTELRQNKDA